MQVLGRLEIGLRTPHQRCVFGRLPSNEVVLEHLSISRQHAQLTLDAAGDLFLTDLGSGTPPRSTTPPATPVPPWHGLHRVAGPVSSSRHCCP